MPAAPSTRQRSAAVTPEDRPVPVSMGSPRFTTWEGPTCLVTCAWFPETAVLHPHVHDRPTFAMILGGGFDLWFTSPAIRRAEFSCTRGTIFTEPVGEKHGNRVSPAGAQVIVIQPDVVNYPLPGKCLELLDRINHFRDGLVNTQGRRLAREVLAPDDLTPLAVEGLVAEILAEAARFQAQTRLSRLSAPGWLRRATDYLHDHFRETVHVQDVAAVAGVHPTHLASVFRRVHGVSLGTYVRRLRVEWSAEQLLCSRTPIAVIAARAGFADQAHLTRWFKHVTGLTPAAYRRAQPR